MGSVLYLGCPRNSYEGDPASLVEQWRSQPTWDPTAWELNVTTYSGDTSVDAVGFAARVLQNAGPVLLLTPIQSNSRIQIQARVGTRVPVLVEEVADLNQLTQAIRLALGAFEAGEPTVHRDLGVAIMLMHKLDANHMWAGNAKGYMWADSLPNGRGFDEGHAGRLGVVISILLRAELLTRKTSKGKNKYALNPENRAAIHEIMRSRRFPDETQNALGANREMLSVRALDHCIAPENIRQSKAE